MFRTDARTLKAALNKVLPVVERRVTMPILAHVRLRVEQDVLTISGTDLDTQIDAEALVEGVPEAATTVDPRPLLGILRLLSGSTAVEVVKEDDGLHVLWSGGHAKFASLKPDDFPTMKPTARSVECTFDGVVAKALARVLPFVSTQETRYYLNGVAMVAIGGHSCLAATDSRRLCVMPGGNTLAAFRAATDVRTPIIPAKAARLWLQMFPVGEVIATAHLSKNKDDTEWMSHFGVSGNGMRLLTKTIDGTYPPLEKVIPKTAATTLTFRRAELIAACRLGVALGRHEKTGTLRSADGRASLLVRTMHGDALALDLGEAAGPLEVGLDLNRFAASVSATRGETVSLAANGVFEPILLRGSDAMDGEAIVAMPLRASSPPVIQPAPLKAAA